MLHVEDTALVLIDVQGKLAQIVENSETLHINISKLIRGFQALEVPILWLEQIPEKLGPTTKSLAELFKNQRPIAKTTFSAVRNNDFMDRLQRSKRRKLLLAGIETHICVYMTASELVANNYYVEVIADAVSSRNPKNHAIGIAKMQNQGVSVTCVETVLYELLGDARSEHFKNILEIVK
ncbi:MAG TPA: isochorismatase family protein [Polyangiaceae bacterium]|jgi:nicotinamidase-related amidase|nr:MAG: Isochorismatase family protein [Deltaproteobacteria bacterium ADurb.Bin207]HQK19182.1 isochorismatase family protein [Polyangiaceae bacterium]HQM10116.1 isochorismatase family protein [Polyangiaceae bacterium]